MDIIKGKTESGFEFEIEKAQLDNYELFEAIAELEEKPMTITKVIKLLLGDEQKKRLVDHCRGENGITSIESMNNEITEILTHNQVKN